MAFLPGSIVCFYKYNRKFGKKNQNDSVFTPKSLVKVLWYRVTGFFLMLSVVKCRQITSTVINYHVGCTISRCHVIAYVCFFICSSLFI